MAFLPNDYESPQATGGNYTKRKTWTTKIRILSDSITGRQDWWNNKPANTKEKQKQLTADRTPKHFRAFAVWNYDENTVQVCQITQRSIMDWIMALYNDEDRGDPKWYDLKINKTGEKMDTKYTITTWPKSKVDDSILKAYTDAKINLNALYEWENPFWHEEELRF